MNAKHTAGPWEANTTGKIFGLNSRPIATLHMFRVADLNEYERRKLDDEFKANARLIAAAPELLAALEDLRKELRAHIRLDVKKHYSLMVADACAGTAIDKARCVDDYPPNMAQRGIDI